MSRRFFDRVTKRVLARVTFFGRFPFLIGPTDADIEQAKREERAIEEQERGPPGAELTEEQRQRAEDDYAARHPPER